jgi:isopentenyl phosphate kinase
VASATEEGCVFASLHPGIASGGLIGPRSMSASRAVGPGEKEQPGVTIMDRSVPAESERGSDPSRVYRDTCTEDVESDEIDHGLELGVDDRGIGDSGADKVELILKIGGSAVTNKREPHELAAKDKFDAIIEKVSRVYSRGVRMIICHGAGSFGHFEARKHAVGEGAASAIGVAATHAAVNRLSWNIVDSLVLRGVPAVSVSPLWHFVRSPLANEGDALSLAIAGLLRRGLVPVIHGDVGYSSDGRSRIYSADELVYMLAMSSTFPHVGRVVFVSDVDGLYTECPSAGGTAEHCAAAVSSGRLINTVAVDSTGKPMWKEARLDSAPATELPSGVVDVTGGMAGKLRWAARIASESRGRIGVYLGGALSYAIGDLFDMQNPVSSEALSRCTSIVYRARTL